MPECSCYEAGQNPQCAIHGSFAGEPGLREFFYNHGPVTITAAKYDPEKSALDVLRDCADEELRDA